MAKLFYPTYGQEKLLPLKKFPWLFGYDMSLLCHFHRCRQGKGGSSNSESLAPSFSPTVAFSRSLSLSFQVVHKGNICLPPPFFLPLELTRPLPIMHFGKSPSDRKSGRSRRRCCMDLYGSGKKNRKRQGIGQVKKQSMKHFFLTLSTFQGRGEAGVQISFPYSQNSDNFPSPSKH